MRSLRHLVPFVLCAVFVLGFLGNVSSVQAGITNGENAIDLLGQDDGTSFTDPVPVYTKFGANDGPNKFGFSVINGLLVDTSGHHLFVADSNNFRIVVYNLNSDNTLPDHLADNVLGQPNFYSGTAANTQTGMGGPSFMAYDAANTRLFVTDANRVMVYNVASITNGMNATNVIGQANFTDSAAANTQTGLNNPEGIAYDAANTRLFVTADTNNRVTVYNVASITNGMNATNVLGQANFTDFAAANTQTGMKQDRDVVYDAANTRLFVVSAGNHRVMVYNVASITNGMNADNVLGQANFTTFAAATSQVGMNSPDGLAYDAANTRLFVGQFTSHRVTTYNVASITNGQNADNVLGQANFTDSGFATTQAGMGTVVGLTYDAGNSRLYAGEFGNRRVTAYNVASITNGQNAVDVLGQDDGTSLSDPVPVYTKAGQNDGPNKFGFNAPRLLAMDTTTHRLFIPDANNRVLVYNLNSDNTLTDHLADFVLGQPNFYVNTAANSQTGMNGVSSVTYDAANTRLFVVDNNRVLVYNVASITNGMNATNVLGQANFTDFSAATSQTGMNTPQAVTYDAANTRLFVSQSGNQRITIYNVATITNGMNATNVLGQANFTVGAAANTQTGFNNVIAMAYDAANTRLFVGQFGSSRVTVYNVASITNGMNATNVLGQANFTDFAGTNTQAGMKSVEGLAYDATNTRLFVAGFGNARVTVYNVASITNGMNATNVLGQANFTDSAAANTQTGMNTPLGLVYDAGNSRLLVTSQNAHRVTFYDVAPATTISGTAYTDEGTITMGSGRTVSISVNGAAAAASTTTASDGTFTVTITKPSAGDVLTVYLDNNTEKGVTVTRADGTVAQSGINIYQNDLITRCDNSSCSLTNANLSTAATNADTDISAIYAVASSNLTLASGKSLFIPSSHTFAPGGNVSVGGNFTNNGTYTKGTETLTLTGTGTQTFKSNGSSFYAITQNGVGGTYTLQDALTLTNTLTITNGTLDVSSSNFALSVGATFSNAGTFTARSGTVTMTGTGTLTTGASSLYNLTINASTLTVTLGSALTLTNNLTITVGTLDVSASNYALSVGGNFSNSGTFTKRAGTVTLAGNAQTLTSGGSGFYGLTINAVASGLVDYWKFDEGSGTSAADAGSNGNTGTLTNGPTWTTSVPGLIQFADASAVQFDGVDDKVTTTQAGPSGHSARTFAAWIKMPSSSGAMPIISYGTETNFQRMVFGTGDDTAANTLFMNIKGSFMDTTSAIPFMDNTWHHVAMTLPINATVGDVKFYIDGQNAAVVDTGAAVVNTGTTNAVMIGNYTGAGWTPFAGSIDDVRIYNRALSANEISVLGGGGSGFGTYTAQDAVNVSHALTITNGTLDLSTFNLTATGATFSNVDTLALAGGQTLTGFTNDTDSGTITYNGSSTYTGLIAGATYNNLVFNGSGTWKQSLATTLNGSLNIINGTFDLNSFNFNLPVTNTFSNTGTLALQGAETISHFSLDTNSGTVLYNGSSTYTGLDLGSTYYALTFNGSGTWLLNAALTTGSALTVTAGTLDYNGYDVTAAGDVINHGTFLNTLPRTLTLNGTSQTFNPGNISFNTLSLTGSSGTVSLGSNFTLTNLLSVAAGRTLAILTNTLNAANAVLTNLGLITFGSGGQLIQASSGFYLANDSFDVAPGYSIPGDKVYYSITDPSANLNGQAQDTISVTIACLHDSETVTGTETTNTSGIFRNSGLTTAVYAGSATNNNGTLSCANGDTITASYTDAHDTTDTQSTTANASTDAHATAPSSFAGTAASGTSITWTWVDNASNEIGFRLYDSSGTLKATIATANATSYTETGLSEATNHSRKLVAYNNAGNSSYSSTVTVQTPLTTPTGLSGTAASNTSIRWTWNDNSSAETGYKLLDENGTTKATLGANVSSYTETGLTKNTAYSRKVVAYNSGGNSTATSLVSVTTTNNQPASFALLSPANNGITGSGLPTFAWDKSLSTGNSIASYTLYVGDLIFTGIHPDGPTQYTDKFTASYFNEHDADDSNDTMSVTLQDSASTDLPLADGSYDWYVVATDDSGNTRTSATRTVIVDSISPTISAISITLGKVLSAFDYTTSSTLPTLNFSTADARGVAQVTVRLDRANFLFGAIVSYTPIETRTYTVNLTKQSLTFTPKEALTPTSYRYTITTTDQAGHTTTQLITLKVLTAEEAQRAAAQEAVNNLNADTDTIDKITTTLRGLLPASALNLPLLEQKAILRAQAQAANFRAFLAGIFPNYADWAGRLERFLAWVFSPLNQLAAAWQRMTTQWLALLPKPHMPAFLVAAQDVRVRQGLANRQALGRNILLGLAPLRALASQVALKTRVTYEVWIDHTPTAISNVAVTKLTPDSATISWQTNHLTRSGKVNFGTSTNYGSQVEETPGLKDHHSVTLTNLKPQQLYYFELMNQSKDYVYDAYYTLTTPVAGVDSSAAPLVPQDAVVTGEAPVPVYDQPSQQGAVVKTLVPGTTLRALTQQDGWVSVLLDNDQKVWIELSKVTLHDHTGASATAK